MIWLLAVGIYLFVVALALGFVGLVRGPENCEL